MKKRHGIYRVTIKHPRFVTVRMDVEADSEKDAIQQCNAGRKSETLTARFLRGPKFWNGRKND